MNKQRRSLKLIIELSFLKRIFFAAETNAKIFFYKLIDV